MWIDGPGSAVNTISRKWADDLKEHKESFKYGHCGLEFSRSVSVETTTLEQLIKSYGMPFFIKIDVEGHELSVLRGLQTPSHTCRSRSICALSGKKASDVSSNCAN